MKYATDSAFRMALEERLRRAALETGVPLVRLRKTVAFDRLLARMVRTGPEAWLLKGGFALQLLIENDARTTKDVDVLLRQLGVDAHEMLVDASLEELGDGFVFAVAEPTSLPAETAVRMAVESRLDGRLFESFHIDVGTGDPVLDAPDRRIVTGLLGFAGIEPTIVPCYPVTQHVAEKLHALSRGRVSVENSRVKDLVDIVLLAAHSDPEAQRLRAAIEATFTARAALAVPGRLPDAPASWVPVYRRMARELGLAADDLDVAVAAARRFLDPILDGTAAGSWRSDEQVWR